jgi:xanthine phosphoribosyltransferase
LVFLKRQRNNLFCPRGIKKEKIMARENELHFSSEEETSLRTFLKSLILEKGEIKEEGILDVTGFLNHQINPTLMKLFGEVVSGKFKNLYPTKVLTAASSGIALGLSVAIELGIPCVFARNDFPITFGEVWQSEGPSHTKGKVVSYNVDCRFLGKNDGVLIVDDFLATGATIQSLIEICNKAEAEIKGIAVAIEKAFEEGQERLTRLLGNQIPIYSVVIIESMDNQKLVFR